MATRILFCAIACDNPRCAKLELFGAEAKVPYQRCSACRRMYYCSAQCQRDHSDAHRPSCPIAVACIYGDHIATARAEAAPVSGQHFELATLAELTGRVPPQPRILWSEMLKTVTAFASNPELDEAMAAPTKTMLANLNRIDGRLRAAGAEDAVVRQVRGLWIARLARAARSGARLGPGARPGA